jgi:hypothetical protein
MASQHASSASLFQLSREQLARLPPLRFQQQLSSLLSLFRQSVQSLNQQSLLPSGDYLLTAQALVPEHECSLGSVLSCWAEVTPNHAPG